jgi:hypothetical protein
MGKKVNLNDIERRHRAEKERERCQAEAERIAKIEERYLKRVLGGAIEDGHNTCFIPGIPGWFHVGLLDEKIVRPHPSDAGRKRLKSPAGETADRKWAVRLPGSFETRKRR